ncbi:MAG: Ppx/GppA phosphatase family protein [Planctomycetota bacterium]|jgi:exopolyphosphatase/guanosine-5'-triphosphate,3'-diphosphate pyrophosphatase
MSAPAPGDPTGHRLAAIDVGTNSIRLVVAEVLPDRDYRVIDDERVLTRLGRGFAVTGQLDPDAMEASAEAIAHLKSIADGLQVVELRAIATCAVREAANGTVFEDLVESRAGLQLEVISAEEEARLAFRSVRSAFDLRSLPTAVVDVGGGSTEIVLATNDVIERVCTLDFGAVRLTERFDLGGNEITEEQYRRMRRAVRQRIKSELGRPPFVPHLLVGTGGTFSNLAAMSMHRGTPNRDSPALPFAVRGYELQRSELKHILDQLRKLPVRERARIPGLTPDRADIIVAGLTIVDCLVKRLSVNRLRVHDGGIRAGLLLDMIDRRWPTSDHADHAPLDRIAGARRFALSCHHDHRHAEHVSVLALQIFDGLARLVGSEDDGWSGEENRELLHAAALLHDVGYVVNYARHHKHSYHLIMHSGLAGFTHRDLDVIANIARYHRGAKPKLKHVNFAELDPANQERVRRLASILRLAVGLDRSHAQHVQSIDVRTADGAAVFELVANEDPSVELWGAERKSQLFKRSFGLEPRFCWTSPAGIEAEAALESATHD